MTNQQNNNDTEQEMTFISHLLELRDRLLRMVLGIIIIFLPLFYFANDLYSYIAGPLLKYMPEGQMIAINVVSPFLTPLKLSMFMAILLAMPYILYQLWGFIAPGLYQHERKLAAPLVFVSTILFYAGMAFAYYVVFPLVFGFLSGQGPEGVSYMPDITAYLDFVLAIFFAFGIAFQVPVATILLVWVGATTPKKLVSKRPFVIVGAFVIGMLLTPPDFISQTLLAIPMWLLFEVGVLFARFYVPKKDDEPAEEEHSIAPAATVAGAGATTGAAASSAAYDDYDEDEEFSSNNSGHQDEAEDESDFVPLTEEEMDAEIDRIEAEMDAMMDEDEEPDQDEESGVDQDETTRKKDKPDNEKD